VPNKKIYSFAIDADLARTLKAVKAKTGVGESEQIRRALRRWFESRGEIKRRRAR
jgi:Ribbon-helix-helix protein, copG family